MENILKIAKNNLKSAVLGGMLLAATSFLFLVVTQKSFHSSTDVLISQGAPGAADYYSLSQSANYLTTILSRSIYSEKFLDDVIATNKVPTNFVSGYSAQRLKNWQKVIRVKTNPNIGIMTIEVFGDTQYQTSQLAQAVLEVLSNQNSFFLGQEKNVDVRILSGPITEKNPSVPQIILVLAGGIAAGMSLVFLYAIYREESFPKNDLKILAEDDRSKGYKSEIKIFPPENLPDMEKDGRNYPASSNVISDEDYLSETSDYWKKRLEENRN